VKIIKELFKGVKEALFAACIVMIFTGIFMTLTSWEWEQLDGIAVILGAGFMLPFVAKKK